MTDLKTIIIETQRTFDGLITKPRLLDKLLKKPPFRFIHDIVTNTIANTGFPDGLYEGEELNSRSFKGKEAKIQWLEKLIRCVRAGSNEEFIIHPNKIVAGLEAENTNKLLQLVGDLGKKVKNNQINMNDLLKLMNNNKNNNNNNMNNNTNTQATKKQKEKSPTISSGSIKSDKSQQNNKNSNVIDLDLTNINYIQRTQKTLGKLIDRPRLLDKLLQRPPFRFLHDIVKSLIKSQKYPSQFLTEQDLTTNRVKDPKFKLYFLKKLINIVSITLNEDLSMISPKKIVAGLEAENTNLLLYKLAIASTRSINVDNIKQQIEKKNNEEKMNQNKNKLEIQQKLEEKLKKEKETKKLKQEQQEKLMELQKQKESQKEGSQHQKKIARKSSNDSQTNSNTISNTNSNISSNTNSNEIDNRPHSRKGNNKNDNNNSKSKIKVSNKSNPVIMPKLDLKELNKDNNNNNTKKEKNISVMKKYNRPRTARRPPPKIESSIIQDNNNSNRSNNNKNIINDNNNNNVLIIDDNEYNNNNDKYSELEEQNIVNELEEQDLTNFGFNNNDNINNNNSNNNNNNNNNSHGKLVRDIIDSQNTGIKLNNKIGIHVKTNKTSLELDKIRDNIQKLCQTSLPLGKCIDLVFEDISVMDNEILKWKSKINKYKNSLIDEKRKTELLLQTYYDKIKSIKNKIKLQQEQILQKQFNLLKNEKLLQDTIEQRILLLVEE